MVNGNAEDSEPGNCLQAASSFEFAHLVVANSEVQACRWQRCSAASENATQEVAFSGATPRVACRRHRQGPKAPVYAICTPERTRTSDLRSRSATL